MIALHPGRLELPKTRLNAPKVSFWTFRRVQNSRAVKTPDEPRFEEFTRINFVLPLSLVAFACQKPIFQPFSRPFVFIRE